jgi:hypothetical protein
MQASRKDGGLRAWEPTKSAAEELTKPKDARVTGAEAEAEATRVLILVHSVVLPRNSDSNLPDYTASHNVRQQAIFVATAVAISSVTEGKISYRRLKDGREDNIKMAVKERDTKQDFQSLRAGFFRFFAVPDKRDRCERRCDTVQIRHITTQCARSSTSSLVPFALSAPLPAC